MDSRSERNLIGVKAPLVSIIRRGYGISPIPFQVIEGVRTLAREKELLKQGATTTLRSRHLTGHAVDIMALVNGKGVWDVPAYRKIAAAMKQAAAELKIPLEWGGDWKSFKDWGHFQLPWKEFP